MIVPYELSCKMSYIPTENSKHCLTGQGHMKDRQKRQISACPMHIAQSSLLRRPCYNWCPYYCWRPICVLFSCNYWCSCCCWRPCIAGVPAITSSLLFDGVPVVAGVPAVVCISPVAGFVADTNDHAVAVSQLFLASLLLLASLL